MKITRTLTILATIAIATATHAASLITNLDSIISLATDVTKNYTFTDTNGQNCVIAVTMTPYSSSNSAPVFTLLDFYGEDGNPVHLGINSGTGSSGDGNWIDWFEGVNFSASLVSASAGVNTNSIQFGIAQIGIRPNGGSLSWISSVENTVFNPNGEALYALDTNMTVLDKGAYSGQLRGVNEGGQYQLSDFLTPADGLVLEATFAEGTVTGAAATLTTGSFASNQFQFSVTGTVGANYIVQSATNLISPAWISLATNSAPFTFTASNTAACGQQFFRAIAQ